MAHFPKPFYRPSRGVWYVQIAGQQLNLGADKGAAFCEYDALMAQPTKVTNAAPPTRATTQAKETDKLVVTVIDAFLDWCQKNRAPRTYDWYKDRAQSFTNSIASDLTVAAGV